MVIESFGSAIPEIAAAACIWRDLAPDSDTLAKHGLAFLRELVAGSRPRRPRRSGTACLESELCIRAMSRAQNRRCHKEHDGGRNVNDGRDRDPRTEAVARRDQADDERG